MDDVICKYGVYVRIDDHMRIVEINSDAFIENLNGWVQIDEGWGDKYHHAQHNYLHAPIRDDRGVCRYKLVNGDVVEREADEMTADYSSMELPQTDAERITALEEQIDMILSGVTSDE